MGTFAMDWHRPLVLVAVLTVCSAGSAQAPHYNLGKTPTEDEIRAWDISISPEGKELPPGNGTATEGAKLYLQKACVACHGPEGRGGLAPRLVGPLVENVYTTEEVMATYSPFATTLWDYINRAMPLKGAGTLKPEEVYALTAFLLYKNDIIQESDVMNAQTLPKVKMPNRDGFVPLVVSSWKPGRPRPFKITPDPASPKK
jgi:mono/diheme cytochrome c family protein